MANFLNIRAQFSCTGGGVPFTVTAGDSKKVTFNGAGVLIQGTKLSGSGICSILTAMSQGTPQKCRCSLSPWTPVDFKHTAEGKALLIATSKSVCQAAPGGIVSVAVPGTMGRFKQGSVSQDASETPVKQTIAAQPNRDEVKVDGGNAAPTNAAARSGNVSSENAAANAHWQPSKGEAMSPLGAVSAVSQAAQKQKQSAAMDEFLRWKNYEPPAGKIVHIKEILDRFKNPAAIEGLCEYLYEEDANFRNTVDNLRQKAKSDRAEAEKQCKINASGKFAEELTHFVFAPYFATVSTQERRDLDDGGYTKIDFAFYGAKPPLMLLWKRPKKYGSAQGTKLRLQRGESLALEVKSGLARYLSSQYNHHLKAQAEGHREFTAHFTIVSRDFDDLSPEKQAEIKDGMWQANSPIRKVLPQKEEIDRLCINYILG